MKTDTDVFGRAIGVAGWMLACAAVAFDAWLFVGWIKLRCERQDDAARGGQAVEVEREGGWYE